MSFVQQVLLLRLCLASLGMWLLAGDPSVLRLAAVQFPLAEKMLLVQIWILCFVSRAALVFESRGKVWRITSRPAILIHAFESKVSRFKRQRCVVKAILRLRKRHQHFQEHISRALAQISKPFQEFQESAFCFKSISRMSNSFKSFKKNISGGTNNRQ